jgi:hypothetical protein
VDGGELRALCRHILAQRDNSDEYELQRQTALDILPADNTVTLLGVSIISGNY